MKPLMTGRNKSCLYLLEGCCRQDRAKPWPRLWKGCLSRHHSQESQKRGINSWFTFDIWRQSSKGHKYLKEWTHAWPSPCLMQADMMTPSSPLNSCKTVLRIQKGLDLRGLLIGTTSLVFSRLLNSTWEHLWDLTRGCTKCGGTWPANHYAAP